MEELLVQADTAVTPLQRFQKYLETHDVRYVAEDAVFHHKGTGESYHGREEIGAMLHYIYHVAFDARAELQHMQFNDEAATLEGLFTGRHIGEFAGIPATNKEVSVPLCVTYSLKDGWIREARIYMLGEVLMRQLQS